MSGTQRVACVRLENNDVVDLSYGAHSGRVGSTAPYQGIPQDGWRARDSRHALGHGGISYGDQHGPGKNLFRSRSHSGTACRTYDSFKRKSRELIARANMPLDLFVFHREPKFLGEKVSIPI